jgi:DNA polymerase III epsilon subunit-like protein
MALRGRQANRSFRPQAGLDEEAGSAHRVPLAQAEGRPSLDRSCRYEIRTGKAGLRSVILGARGLLRRGYGLMALDFCAIDFETANSFRGSPCAVGMARVVDGRLAATQRGLMRPPEGYDEFDAFNVMLHGITPKMVTREPRFADILPEIVAFVDGLPFVAHNAAFDMGVIRDACGASEIAWPQTSYACTLVLPRVTWKLLSYSLQWVAEAAGVELGQHHEPEADARAGGSIMVAIAREHGAASLEELVSATGVQLGSLAPGAWFGCHRTDFTHFVPATNQNADPNNPLYGREIVFTGALSSMTRETAWQVVASVGGQPCRSVTKGTNILVMGYQDAGVLRPGECLSGKARRAEELRAAGQAIEVMCEADFLQHLKA